MTITSTTHAVFNQIVLSQKSCDFIFIFLFSKDKHDLNDYFLLLADKESEQCRG